MFEKDWKSLTIEEVQDELRELLRESENEKEFKEKCNNRFKGPIMMVSWSERWRSVYIATYKWNYSIGADVFV